MSGRFVVVLLVLAAGALCEVPPQGEGGSGTRSDADREELLRKIRELSKGWEDYEDGRAMEVTLSELGIDERIDLPPRSPHAPRDRSNAGRAGPCPRAAVRFPGGERVVRSTGAGVGRCRVARLPAQQADGSWSEGEAPTLHDHIRATALALLCLRSSQDSRP